MSDRVDAAFGMLTLAVVFLGTAYFLAHWLVANGVPC